MCAVKDRSLLQMGVNPEIEIACVVKVCLKNIDYISELFEETMVDSFRNPNLPHLCGACKELLAAKPAEIKIDYQKIIDNHKSDGEKQLKLLVRSPMISTTTIDLFGNYQ